MYLPFLAFVPFPPGSVHSPTGSNATQPKTIIIKN